MLIDAGDEETKLSTGEIVADSVGFLLAGYETTSIAITFATYLLAKNPEVQEKLANEVHEYFDENPVSDHDVVCFLFACAFQPCMHTNMYIHTIYTYIYIYNNIYIYIYMVGAKINFAFCFIQTNTKCWNGSCIRVERC